MARIPNGIFGKAIGSVASISGAEWKGINYIKERKAPRNPSSDLQQLHRNAYQCSNNLAKLVKPSLMDKLYIPYLARQNQPITWQSDFIKRNIHAWNDITRYVGGGGKEQWVLSSFSPNTPFPKTRFPQIECWESLEGSSYYGNFRYYARPNAGVDYSYWNTITLGGLLFGFGHVKSAGTGAESFPLQQGVVVSTTHPVVITDNYRLWFFAYVSHCEVAGDTSTIVEGITQRNDVINFGDWRYTLPNFYGKSRNSWKFTYWE